MNRIVGQARFDIVLVCILIGILITAVPASAKSRFEAGFQGIAWGTAKDQLPDLGLSQGSLKNIVNKGYSTALFLADKGNLAMDMEGIPLLSIFLRFHDAKLYGADLVFSPEYHNRIHAVVAVETGNDGEIRDGEIHWRSRQLTLVLTDRELIVTSEAFNPDRTEPVQASGGPLPDTPCCPTAN